MSEVAEVELLYGRHAVLEALRANRRRIYRVRLAEGVRATGIVADILEAAAGRGCPVLQGAAPIWDRVTPVKHQGVIAETAPYPYVDLAEALRQAGTEDPLFLVLDHLQDVQNLGTLLRTAEAMAVSAVLLPARRSAGITPAVVNASAGAVEHLRIALVGNLVQALEQLKAAAIWIVGLDMSPEAVPLHQADLRGPLAIVVGSESTGLGRLVREHCDWAVRIPMYGVVGSLNAAVAGSIALVRAREARA